MNSKNLFLRTLSLLIFMTSVFVSSAQVIEEREGPSIRHSAHLKTFYSEVDYRIAKQFIAEYKNSVLEKSSPAIEAIGMHSSLSAAIENAQFKEQYHVNGSFQGIRVYYGLKDGNKVAVVLPATANGRVSNPAGHEKVYVVNLPQGFHDPCPPLCD